MLVILIPVIDLAAGEVVHARGGERAAYRPLRSRLCASCEPTAVVGGLLALHPFRHLYIADLDAISGSGDQRNVIDRLHATFPRLQLWVDAGIARHADWRCQGSHVPVIGSETLADRSLLATPAVRAASVLSLDFRHDSALDPSGVHQHPELWPERVIGMSLGRVGSGRGPDLARLRELRARAPSTELYAAGGIAGPADLESLRRLGLAGALLASALHDGAFSREQLRNFTP